MESKNQEPSTTDDLIVLVRKDCCDKAKKAETKLKEAIDCLENENHLGALGAVDGLDNDIRCLKAFLIRIARLTGMPPQPL